MIGKEVIPLNSLQPFVELDNTTKIFFAFFLARPPSNEINKYFQTIKSNEN